ncbi:outer membrane protein assembly factor BamB family protein [Virgisporangium aurantiacum]|uniref:Pyrrolo-quinoline quinone repeat domain-containing protein n=1 Tax=Virgisporangium aurantiacum TaxID=175570 RepID=A0A8J3YW91_9ACTN|nr:PQQ-binding-like beta-propeller repeat protein [Virgisporangium aurantiacum]GIJ52829.1 hypothetical protein Vau01_003450 [Virgisporangium aurantiacum]
MAETLIELGELDREDPPPADRRRPWPPPWLRLWLRPWQGPPNTRLRTALVVAVVAFAALVIGPATLPLPARFDGPSRIPGSGADEFFFAGDLVVVHSGNERVLRAYGLDGTLRWATAVPFQRAGPYPVVGGVLLVVTPTRPDEVVALDLATGQVRWTVDGDLSAVAEGVVVVGRGPVELETNIRIRNLTGIDPATGRELWHEVIPPLAAGERILRVSGFGSVRDVARARVRTDGTADVLDLRAGTWSTITGVPPAPSPWEEQVQPGTAAGYQVGIRAGDITLVFAVGSEPAEGAANIAQPGTLVAYGPGAGAPRWVRLTGTWAPALPCGPWVCLADGAKSQVLDPATGAELRRVGWPHVLSGNDRRLLGYTDADTDLDVAVFDAVTGRALSHHRGWHLVNQNYSDWTPIIHRDRGLTWTIAALSMETGTAYPLGTFEAAGERSCQSSATHVACSVRSGEIMVWRHVPSR